MGKTALLISSTSFAWRFWFFFYACWEVWTSSAAFGREGDHISLITSRLPLLGLDLQLQVSTHMQDLGGAGLGRDRRSRRCRGAAAHFLTGGFWRARSWGGFSGNAQNLKQTGTIWMPQNMWYWPPFLWMVLSLGHPFAYFFLSSVTPACTSISAFQVLYNLAPESALGKNI